MKTIFFCGHKSAYGMAHVEPLLKTAMNVKKIVIADNEQWKLFKNKINGCDYDYIDSLIFKKILIKIKKIIYNVAFFSKKNNINIFKICKENNIDLEIVHNVNDSLFIDKILNEKYDLFISAAYPQIFCQDLLSLPMFGAVNFHPSVLPMFRGAHPHYWALYTGSGEGGVTAHFMTPNIDDGDIIAQIKFSISQLNYDEYYKKIILETSNIVKKVEFFFNSDCGEIVKQCENNATYFKNDRVITHRIFWSKKTADDVVNMVRAGYSYFYLGVDKIYVLKCVAEDKNHNVNNDFDVEYGTIVELSESFVVVKCKEKFLKIYHFKIRNKHYKGVGIIRKYKLQIGYILQ